MRLVSPSPHRATPQTAQLLLILQYYPKNMVIFQSYNNMKKVERQALLRPLYHRCILPQQPPFRWPLETWFCRLLERSASSVYAPKNSPEYYLGETQEAISRVRN